MRRDQRSRCSKDANRSNRPACFRFFAGQAASDRGFGPFNVCQLRCAVQATTPERSRHDVFPPSDPRRRAAFVLAVFLPRRSDDQFRCCFLINRFTVRCVSFVADVLRCLCAVPGTHRGLSQPGRGFVPPTLLGFVPSQCFSGPWVKTPFGVSRPHVVLRRCSSGTRIWPEDATFGCVNARRVCDFRGLAPRASCADLS
jgi:hypothetical protein